MGGSSAPKNTTSTTTNSPPAFLQPYLQQYAQGASNLASKPYTPYAGQRIAPFTGEQEAGLKMTTNRALQGSPVMNQAQNEAQRTLGGYWLSPDSNPFLKQEVNRQMGDIQGRINAQFNNGAFGGTAHQEMLTRNLGDVSNQLYGQNFANERGNQMRSMMFAPELAASDYKDAQALLGVGDVRREAGQDALNMVYEEFLNAQQWPYQQADFLGSSLARAQGGAGVSNTVAPNPYRPNRTANAIGGAAAGGALGGMMGGATAGSVAGPWGAGLGALAGLFM